MSLNAATIRLLIEKGLSADDIADVAEALETTDARVSPAGDEGKSKGAIRQAKYRERAKAKASQNVTDRNAEHNETSQSVTDAPPLSLPPSFPPNPQTNPPPTHPHGGKPARVRGSKRDDVFVLPDDIPQAEWDAFVEMRRMTKQPMTDHAKRLAINDLRKIHAERGHSFAAVLNQSTLNNWRGLFALKDERNGRTNSHRDGRSAWLNESGTGLGGAGDGGGLFDQGGF